MSDNFHIYVDIVQKLSACDPRDDHGFCTLCGNFVGSDASVKYSPKQLMDLARHSKHCCYRIAKELNATAKHS